MLVDVLSAFVEELLRLHRTRAAGERRTYRASRHSEPVARDGRAVHESSGLGQNDGRTTECTSLRRNAVVPTEKPLGKVVERHTLLRAHPFSHARPDEEETQQPRPPGTGTICYPFWGSLLPFWYQRVSAMYQDS